MPDVDRDEFAERVPGRKQEPVLGAALEQRPVTVAQQVDVAGVDVADEQDGHARRREGVGTPAGHRRHEVVIARPRLVVAQHGDAALTPAGIDGEA